MVKIYNFAYFKDKIVPFVEANLSVASSSVLYGLSVYTVLPVYPTPEGFFAFRLSDHYKRLVNSSRIIGIDDFESNWDFKRFEEAIGMVVKKNSPKDNIFVRVTVHIDSLVPGTRSRGLSSILSVFLYEASPILPSSGARLKTSAWRRVSDCMIPARAKVNGAYVNSVLAKQEALDNGCDDCLFLDQKGHVCELSAANIFIVRNGQLITPSPSSDILEGINRKTILEISKILKINSIERDVDLTEIYVADEVFACGTSAFVTHISEIDNRVINNGNVGKITSEIKKIYKDIFSFKTKRHNKYFSRL